MASQDGYQFTSTIWGSTCECGLWPSWVRQETKVGITHQHSARVVHVVQKVGDGKDQSGPRAATGCQTYRKRPKI